MPKLSVIMPVYNASPYLGKAISSILNQTYIDYEFLIFDDGSTDNSLEIMRQFESIDSRVKVFMGPNKGLVSTLNSLINLSKGDFIARMDADDISAQNRFNSQMSLLLSSGADICGCHWHVIDIYGKFISSNLVPLTFDSIVPCLSHTTPFAHGSVIMRRQFLTENNIYYSQDSNVEDYELWIRCFEHGAKIVNANEFLYSYRVLNNSLSTVNRKRNLIETKMRSRKFVKNNISICISSCEKLSKSSNLLTAIEGFFLLWCSYLLIPYVGPWNFLRYLKLTSNKSKFYFCINFIRDLKLSIFYNAK